MGIIKNVSRWGNSAGVLLPRKWMGSRVKIEIIENTKDIKGEIINILEPYLEDILGVYLTGSYAREEQEEDSDVDAMAVSKEIKKEIVSGRYHISIAPLYSIKRSIKKSPILILPRIREAKAILNSQLLRELDIKKLSAKDFLGYFKETKRVISINRKFIEMDKESSDYLESKDIVYSLILRLRGMFIIRKLLKNEKYSKKGFLKFLGEGNLSKADISHLYELYKQIRNGNKAGKKDIKIETAQKLLELLVSEVKKYGK